MTPAHERDTATRSASAEDPAERVSAGRAIPARTAEKRRAIVEAATRLFLQQGYDGTSMDEIAAAAAVSKQTVYKQFVDKEQLFGDMVLGIAERADGIVEALNDGFARVTAAEEGLALLAETYAAAVLAPAVLALRRLVISEASRFPDLARAYYARAPARGLEAVAAGLQALDRRSLLHVRDPPTAATHFAYLVLGPLIDSALFDPSRGITEAEISMSARAGVSVFMAAYG